MRGAQQSGGRAPRGRRQICHARQRRYLFTSVGLEVPEVPLAVPEVPDVPPVVPEVPPVVPEVPPVVPDVPVPVDVPPAVVALSVEVEPELLEPLVVGWVVAPDSDGIVAGLELPVPEVVPELVPVGVVLPDFSSLHPARATAPPNTRVRRTVRVLIICCSFSVREGCHRKRQAHIPRPREGAVAIILTAAGTFRQQLNRGEPDIRRRKLKLPSPRFTIRKWRSRSPRPRSVPRHAGCHRGAD